MIGNDPAFRAQRNAQLSKIRPRSQDAEFPSYRSRSPISKAYFGSQQQQQQNEEENEEKRDGSEHQLACPWHKVKRLKSKENQQKGELHPRAWGVRSPQDIRCTCKLPKNEIRKPSRPNTTNFSILLSMKTPAYTDFKKVLEDFSKQVEKAKVTLNKDEINEIVKKIRGTLEKKVSGKGDKKSEIKVKRPASATHSHTVTSQADRNPIPLVPHSPTKDRPAQRHHTTTHHHGTGVENIMLTNHAGLTMTPTAVVGTMESTNYVIELTAAQTPKQTGEIKNFMSQVIPLSMGTDNKPKLVSVDGAYFAEIPPSYGGGTPMKHQQIRADGGVMRKRTENVTFYAMADHQNQQVPSVTFAKPKSPYSNTKYIPVTKVPAMHMHHTPIPVTGTPHMQATCKPITKR